jgi:hypothetical protein
VKKLQLRFWEVKRVTSTYVPGKEAFDPIWEDLGCLGKTLEFISSVEL